VVIYLPMVPEAVVAMLACARIGAVHSVVFGGFAAAELATRIEDARPVAIVSASCGIEASRVVEYKPILDRAIGLSAHKPRWCVVLQRPQAGAPLLAGRDLDWAGQMAAAQPAGCVPVAAADPLYILYTSGTTGKPKGVVRDNGGHAVALAWSMQHVYDTQPGEVFWAASDIGWVVGHSYVVYAPLLAGCTTVLYEGKPVGTPDAGPFSWAKRYEGGRCGEPGLRPVRPGPKGLVDTRRPEPGMLTGIPSQAGVDGAHRATDQRDTGPRGARLPWPAHRPGRRGGGWQVPGPGGRPGGQVPGAS
jgi:acyl-CoA synthetase (AMP-forming)/AMP-acid ligase II